MNKGMVCYWDNWKGNRKDEWMDCPQLLQGLLLLVLLPKVKQGVWGLFSPVFLRLGCRDGSPACR